MPEESFRHHLQLPLDNSPPSQGSVPVQEPTGKSKKKRNKEKNGTKGKVATTSKPAAPMVADDL
jgi:hypothetical protein